MSNQPIGYTFEQSQIVYTEIDPNDEESETDIESVASEQIEPEENFVESTYSFLKLNPKTKKPDKISLTQLKEEKYLD